MSILKRNFFFAFCIILSCNSKIKSELEVLDFYVQGKIDSSHLEQGEWQFFDLKTKEISQKGSFLNGLRVGTWHYLPSKDTINWNIYYGYSNFLKTNIPSFLKLDTEEIKFVSFINKNESNLFKLKIGFDSKTLIDTSTYNNLIRKDVNSNSIKILSYEFKKIKTTCDRTYNLYRFLGIDKQNVEYFLLTVNGFINDYFVEITMRCDMKDKIKGENVFFAVMSNVFFNNERFFDENIDCKIIRNKQTRRLNFNLGCGTR